MLTDLAQRARSGPPGWFAKWADIEARASLIRWFEPLLVPGLIQTEPYARAVLGWKPDSGSAEANLTTRLARQSVLDRAELRVVILGSVLNREVGDASVMCEQIEHLLAVGSRPSVMIQIVPDTPAVAGALGGAFAIATEETADVAAYTDSIVKGGVYTDPDLIARAARVFDGLRADALPVDTDSRSSQESRRTMDALNWRKASYSASNGGCVEVADHSNRVLVRDTQDRTGPVLRFSPAGWRVFADRVKRSLASGPVRAGRCQ